MTDDLPTPPLPDATAITLVSESGFDERNLLGGLSAAQGLLQVLALLLAHHVEDDVDGLDAVDPD